MIRFGLATGLLVSLELGSVFTGALELGTLELGSMFTGTGFKLGFWTGTFKLRFKSRYLIWYFYSLAPKVEVKTTNDTLYKSNYLEVKTKDVGDILTNGIVGWLIIIVKVAATITPLLSRNLESTKKKEHFLLEHFLLEHLPLEHFLLEHPILEYPMMVMSMISPVIKIKMIKNSYSCFS